MDLTTPDLLGYVFGAGALAAALNVVTRRDAVVAAMFLVLTFFCLSGIYLLLGFPFLAAVQVLVYAGAIMVLFLFVIMLLGITTLAPVRGMLRPGMGAAVALALAVEGVVVGLELAAKPAAPATGAPAGESVESIARLMFDGPLVLPFQVAGVLLLAAMVAVVVLARRAPDQPTLASRARELAFDPRPLVVHAPEAAAPDGLAMPERGASTERPEPARSAS